MWAKKSHLIISIFYSELIFSSGHFELEGERNCRANFVIIFENTNDDYIHTMQVNTEVSTNSNIENPWILCFNCR